jgi:hypothetical protein
VLLAAKIDFNDVIILWYNRCRRIIQPSGPPVQQQHHHPAASQVLPTTPQQQQQQQQPAAALLAAAFPRPAADAAAVSREAVMHLCDRCIAAAA